MGQEGSATGRRTAAVTLGVQGMTCAACVRRVERGLAKLPGVEEATVNLTLERASVRFDPELVTVDDLAAKVRDLGYDVITDRVTLAVVGMTCANCATRIEKGLNKLPGVKATVNLATETAHVEYLPSVTSLDDVRRKIADLGYKAIIPDEAAGDREKEAREAEIRRQKRLFALAALLSFPLLASMVGHMLGIDHGWVRFS